MCCLLIMPLGSKNVTGNDMHPKDHQMARAVGPPSPRWDFMQKGLK